MDWHDISIPQEERKKQIIAYYKNKGYASKEAIEKADRVLAKDSDYAQSVRIKIIDKVLDNMKDIDLEKVDNFVRTGLYELTDDVIEFRKWKENKSILKKNEEKIEAVLGIVNVGTLMKFDGWKPIPMTAEEVEQKVEKYKELVSSYRNIVEKEKEYKDSLFDCWKEYELPIDKSSEVKRLFDETLGNMSAVAIRVGDKFYKLKNICNKEFRYIFVAGGEFSQSIVDKINNSKLIDTTETVECKRLEAVDKKKIDPMEYYLNNQ